MARFLLRRIVYLVLLVAVATTLAYLLAGTQLNPRLRFEGRNPPPSEASITATLDELNMNPDTPVLKRYATWVNGVFHGDLGETILGQSVNQQISTRMWVSLRLVLIGSIVGAIVGCAIGAYGAVKQYRLSDHVATICRLSCCRSRLSCCASSSSSSGRASTGDRRDRERHADLLHGRRVLAGPGRVDVVPGPGRPPPAWLPADARARHRGGRVLQPLSAKLDARRARPGLPAYGAGERADPDASADQARPADGAHPAHHVLRYNLALLFIGSTFVEIIFTWHGMGEYLVTSVTTQDINSTAATTLFVAVLVLLAGFLSDIAYAALDPRVRVS